MPQNIRRALMTNVGPRQTQQEKKDQYHHLQTSEVMAMDLVMWSLQLIPAVFRWEMFLTKIAPIWNVLTGTTFMFKHVVRAGPYL